MKRIFNICFLLSLLIIGCNKEKEQTDLTEYNLFGSVKTVHQTIYKAVESFGEIEKGEKLNYSFTVMWEDRNKNDRFFIEFDKEGRKINSIKYNPSCDCWSEKIEFVYDNKGNLLVREFYFRGFWINLQIYDEYSKTVNHYDADDNLIEVKEYESPTELKHIEKLVYNKANDLTEKSKYLADGSLSSKTINKYDDKGNLIEEMIFDSYGKLNYKNAYKYNQMGLMVEENNYDSDENLKRKIVVKYDNKGNDVERIGYNGVGDFLGKVTTKYDKFGNPVKVVIYDNNEVLESKSLFEYDKNGNITVESEFDKNGILLMEKRIIYDVKNNKIEESLYEKDKDVRSEIITYYYVYEVDNNNNWIKKTIYKGEEPKYILEREIEYFN